MSVATIPVLHADLREGRTYYVRMLFGEWDDRGPLQHGLRPGSALLNGMPYSKRACAKVPQTVTSAMVALSPAAASGETSLRGPRASPTWCRTALTGQAWLDANRAALESHVAVAEARFEELRPDAKRLATLPGPDDGSPR